MAESNRKDLLDKGFTGGVVGSLTGGFAGMATGQTKADNLRNKRQNKIFDNAEGKPFNKASLERKLDSNKFRTEKYRGLAVKKLSRIGTFVGAAAGALTGMAVSSLKSKNMEKQAMNRYLEKIAQGNAENYNYLRPMVRGGITGVVGSVAGGLAGGALGALAGKVAPVNAGVKGLIGLTGSVVGAYKGSVHGMKKSLKNQDAAIARKKAI